MTGKVMQGQVSTGHVIKTGTGLVISEKVKLGKVRVQLEIFLWLNFLLNAALWVFIHNLLVHFSLKLFIGLDIIWPEIRKVETTKIDWTHISFDQSIVDMIDLDKICFTFN